MDEDLDQLKIILLLSLRSYPDQAFRMIFDTQHEQMKKWDRLVKDGTWKIHRLFFVYGKSYIKVK